MTTNATGSSVDVAVVQAGSVPFDTGACVEKAVRLIEQAAATVVGHYSRPDVFRLIVNEASMSAVTARKD